METGGRPSLGTTGSGAFVGSPDSDGRRISTDSSLSIVEDEGHSNILDQLDSSDGFHDEDELVGNTQTTRPRRCCGYGRRQGRTSTLIAVVACGSFSLMLCGALLLSNVSGNKPPGQVATVRHDPSVANEERRRADETQLSVAAHDVEVAPVQFYGQEHNELRKRLFAAFKVADVDGDGTLSAGEVFDHLQNRQVTSLALFSDWDADRNKLLTLDEMAQGLSSDARTAAARATARDRWHDAFSQLDLDGDAQLTRDEFVGSSCAQCIIMMTDTNRDGKIEIGELLQHEADAVSFGAVLQWIVGDLDLLAAQNKS